MMYLSRIFQRKKSASRIAEDLLSAISLQARNPIFFGDDRVSDSLDGRFEVMTIHAVLVLRRLRRIESDGPRLSKKLSDRLFDNFDYALRESGIGDFSIARKIRALGENYVGRAQAYDDALKTDIPALEEALKRNLFDVAPSGAFISKLARYMFETSEKFADASDQSLRDAQLPWADAEHAIDLIK